MGHLKDLLVLVRRKQPRILPKQWQNNVLCSTALMAWIIWLLGNFLKLVDSYISLLALRNALLFSISKDGSLPYAVDHDLLLIQDHVCMLSLLL